MPLAKKEIIDSSPVNEVLCQNCNKPSTREIRVEENYFGFIVNKYQCDDCKYIWWECLDRRYEK